jgi:hypothetical protein
MKKYICVKDHKSSGLMDGTLTIGNKYYIKQDPKRLHMFIINHYDNEIGPAPLNDYWFNTGFKEIPTPNLNNKINIL